MVKNTRHLFTVKTVVLALLAQLSFAQTVAKEEDKPKATPTASPVAAQEEKTKPSAVPASKVEQAQELPSDSQSASPAGPMITQELEVFLVDETGESVSQYLMSLEKDATEDLRFKSNLAKDKRNYISWAIEFSDPLKNLNTRIANDGKVPETMRWNGKFGELEKIRPRGRYYYRLILATEDEKLYASPWVSFSTRLKNRSEGVKMSEKFINLYVAPMIGFETQSVRTKSYSDSGLALVGDLRFILNDRHTFAIRYESTNDRFISSTSSATDLNFSDFSFAYRLNLVGHPYKIEFADKETFAVQLGAKAFASVIRGGGNLPVDSESARTYQGVSGTLNLEQRFGNFRLLEGAEAGYSVFRSKHTLIGFEGALIYEGFRRAGIGLHGSYKMVDGKPAADVNDGGNSGATTISNKVLMAGLSLYFKI